MSGLARVRSPAALALATLILALAGCYGTQVYPSLQQQLISLRPGDLEASGIAFITPSTVTGQEQEKQAVALTFSDVIKRERPGLRENQRRERQRSGHSRTCKSGHLRPLSSAFQWATPA